MSADGFKVLVTVPTGRAVFIARRCPVRLKFLAHMPFPDAPRVKYRKNPLERVVCQLRYPPILRIEEVPTSFQERVRGEFPIFSEKIELKVEVPSQPLPPETLAQLVQASATKNYEFSSEDGSWQINLTRNCVALATKRYTGWGILEINYNCHYER